MPRGTPAAEVGAKKSLLSAGGSAVYASQSQAGVLPRAIVNKTTRLTAPRLRWMLGSLFLALTVGTPVRAAQTPPASTGTTNTAAAELQTLFEKEENITNSLGMVMTWIPTGKYRVAACEVTQADYEQVVASNPSKHKGARRPVESVTLADAVQFCRLLTEREQADGKLPKNYAYGLPTEAEWETYAAGTSLETAYVSYIGDRLSTTDVGRMPANPLGLFDVRGNVWEWCSSGAARGGSYQSHEDYLNLSFRFVGTPETKLEDIGFRVVLRQTGPRSSP